MVHIADYLSFKVHIPLDPAAKTPKGVAYVTFADPSNAVAAYEALDKMSFQGRLLHVLPAVDRRGKPEVVDGDEKKKTLKEERDAKRKGIAGKEFNWAMLYMNVRSQLNTVKLIFTSFGTFRAMPSCHPSQTE